MISGHAQTYISKEGKEYRQEVFGLVRQIRPVKILGRVKLEVIAHPPDRRARDLDNLLKSLLDAMGHAGVYHDDSQIDELTITRGYPTEDGCVHVVAREIADLASYAA